MVPRERSRLYLFILLAVLSGAIFAAPAAEPLTAASPGGVLAVKVGIDDGRPWFSVARFDRDVVAQSYLGLRLIGEPSLADGLELLTARRRTVDETWSQPWGERSAVRNHFNELAVDFGRRGTTALSVVFRVFDEGVGFRYEIPAGAAGGERRIADEVTEFALTGDHTAWWTGAYLPNRYEYLYRRTPLSAIWKAVTPLTMKTAGGLYLSIHEAALTDYAEMTLERLGEHRLKADLVPWSDGVKVKTRGAFVSPWRTIQIADSAARLIDSSDLILNLNEPNRLGDVSWVQPGKYVGVWWEMHIRKSTWASGPRHGATTANTKRYIDFAARHGFDGVLVEGWNLGWDGDWIANAEQFDFTTPYPDYDFDALAEYAVAKGVRLIGHHETSGGIENYERQLEAAMAYMAEHGVRAVKTGYVKQNGLLPRHDENDKLHHEWQHGQYMVRHLQHVLEAAARHHIAINTHEPVKDTGLRRTWPNWMTREGQRGQEYNAWSDGNGPAHTTILPFTRLLAGPMDFTPGIFDLGSDEAQRERNIPTTLAKQLALYVVIYSPLQMAADLPENYEAKPQAFKFIEDVPADWAESRALAGEIGEYVVIARRDRASRDWYLGAITNADGRLLHVPLGFLESGAAYRAEIYRDGDEAHWEHNPEEIVIETRNVRGEDVLELRLAPGGGAAVRFIAVEPAGNPVRPNEDELIYFIMPDRFANGDPANDRGGIAGGPEQHGFDPAHKGFYHGGDFRGIAERLDYIQGLGASAIWLTPVFKNKPVQGPPGQLSAGYHGYWITDFTTVDPHLGTEDDYRALVDAAHERGMKVFMDIVTNHTADVIQYRECSKSDPATGIGWSDCAYRSIADYPYTTRGGAGGAPINGGFLGDAPEHQTVENFARLTAPDYAYTVLVPENERRVKVPEWLNNPLYYHNRGNSTWEGESVTYGDFSGLDDVYTENPRVVAGMIDIYRSWIRRFKVDGFRIDTAKHVNDEFWLRFIPAMIDEAKANGIGDFYLFGEAYELTPPALARYTAEAGFPAVLDFALRDALQDVASGKKGPVRLAEVFAADPLYRGDPRGALILPTFLGNHDDGRIGRALLNELGEAADGMQLLQRSILAHALLLFARGVPVIYYGDEQGFTGDGRDQDAREDMFASRVASYNDNRLIASTATTAGDNFDTTHPQYRAIAEMAGVYHRETALRRGRQKVLYAADEPGLFVFTRDGEGTVYLLVANTADDSHSRVLNLENDARHWKKLLGEGGALSAAEDGMVRIEQPPLSFSLYRGQE
mgnify:CR=1 FL=1